MAKKNCGGPAFVGTPAQEQALQAAIAKYKSQAGALMPVMQEAQEIYGYLPIEVQKMIAAGLDVPLSEVFGVATFYAQFTLQPKGRYKLSVCLGTACYVKGAGEIYEEIKKILKIGDGECTADGKFSLDSCRCVGACGLAPVLMVNDEVYGRLTAKDVPDILKKYQDMD